MGIPAGSVTTDPVHLQLWILENPGFDFVIVGNLQVPLCLSSFFHFFWHSAHEFEPQIPDEFKQISQSWAGFEFIINQILLMFNIQHSTLVSTYYCHLRSHPVPLPSLEGCGPDYQHWCLPMTTTQTTTTTPLRQWSITRAIINSLSTWAILTASKLTCKNGHDCHFMTRSMRW